MIIQAAYEVATQGSWPHSGAPKNVDELGRAAIKLCRDKCGIHFKVKKSKCAKGTNFSNVEKFLANDTNVSKEKNDQANGSTENKR